MALPGMDGNDSKPGSSITTSDAVRVGSLNPNFALDICFTTLGNESLVGYCVQNTIRKPSGPPIKIDSFLLKRAFRFIKKFDQNSFRSF